MPSVFSMAATMEQNAAECSVAAPIAAAITGDALAEVLEGALDSVTRVHFGTTCFWAYFADGNPSAHENSRNSSFGGDTFRYVRTEVKGSSSATGSMDVILSSRTPGDVNLMRSRTVN